MNVVSKYQDFILLREMGSHKMNDQDPVARPEFEPNIHYVLVCYAFVFAFLFKQYEIRLISQASIPGRFLYRLQSNALPDERTNKRFYLRCALL